MLTITLRAALLIATSSSGLHCSSPHGTTGSPIATGSDVATELATTDSAAHEALDSSSGRDTSDAWKDQVEVPPGKTMGRVTVEQVLFSAEQVSTVVNASFTAAPSPQLKEVLMDDGVCQLLAWKIHFCDSPCGTAWCSGPDECSDYPEYLSVGPLTLDGSATPLTLEPDFSSRYWLVVGENLFGASDVVTVGATGASEFTVAAQMVQAMEVTNAQEMRFFGDIDPTTDFEVRWVPGDSGSDSRVRIRWEAETASHALPDARSLHCDVPDTGSMTISQPLLAAFLDPAHHGGENGADSSISRYRKRSVDTSDGGVVEFTVVSSVRVDK